MDVSVIAAVGSFAVSERILKPKATLLVLLGCVLAYDLTTKTHDVSSLRVYRGPALLAFTLMMAAYSLRTWRRNGVACDELLFLPGTSHGQRHGIDAPPVEPLNGDDVEAAVPVRSEGDVAAGVGWNKETAAQDPVVPTVELGGRQRSPSIVSHTMSNDGSFDDSINEFANSWEETEHDEDDEDEDGQLVIPLNLSSDTADGSERRRTTSTTTTARVPTSSRARNTLEMEATSGDRQQAGLERFRENHPRITRLGTFFFFRSSQTSTESAAYAPSGPSVVGAAMDMTMPVLFNFHMFIEAFNSGNEALAKILPLIFLSVLIVRSVFPPSRRGRFWSTVKFTFAAPFHKIRFRDAFIGDVFTSLVRPVQDVLFALSYYVTVIYGTATGRYGLSTSGQILESSWILHNVVLPSCALLPLWWRFLQCLRESYDSGKRWPALGNAFKYMSAAMVILYGMTHHEDRRSPWWIVCFVLCVLYQIWWDTIMDWELVTIARRPDETLDVENVWFRHRLTSVRPNSCLFRLQRKVFQPVCDCVRLVIVRVPGRRQIQLRPTRLYKTDSFYWKIFAYNALFRFTWMLCYIPAYHLSPSGEEHVTTFSSDTHSYVGVILPIVEILRRTFWGFLYLERETIRMMDDDPKYSSVNGEDGLEINEESEASLGSTDSSKSYRQYLPSWLGNQQQLQVDAAMSTPRSHRLQCDDEMRRKLFIAELSTWALAFVGLGLWATN